MKIFIIAFVLSLFTLPITNKIERSTPAPDLTLPVHDVRYGQLTAFFNKHNCPKPYYVPEYIKAADRYHISYAVLPAISVLESSCGRHYLYANYWGWNSARNGFNSVPEGIDFVSSQLTNGHPYKGKTLKAKIQTYNPPSVNPAYYNNFLTLYNELRDK